MDLQTTYATVIYKISFVNPCPIIVFQSRMNQPKMEVVCFRSSMKVSGTHLVPQ